MSRRRWLVRGLLLFVLAFANLNDIRASTGSQGGEAPGLWSPDVLPNALFAWTVIKEHDVDYDEFVFPPTGAPSKPPPEVVIANRDKLDREAYFFRACGVSTATAPPTAKRSLGGPPAPGPNDHVCSVFPPGMGILALPFFAPFVLTGSNPLDLGLLVHGGHVVAAIVEILATLVLWSVLRRFATARWALVLVLLYFLATSVRTVASQALWQHSGVHLAMASALWLTLREEPIPLSRDLAAGVLLGLGGVVRQTTALAALGLHGFRPTRIFWMVVGTVIGLAPLLAYNDLAFGSPLEQGYGVKSFATPIQTGLYGLLLSPSRGLFVYTPYLIFGFFALLRAWRWPGEVAGRLRGLSLVWLAALVLYATYAEWWGGRVFGSRFLDDFAPILFVAIGWGTSVGMLGSRFARVVFGLMAAWSFVIFQAAAFLYDKGWDTVPVNVNDDPSKLFNWSDPQWLAVLRLVPSADERVIAGAVLSALVLVLLVRLELRASRGSELASQV
jgi:drug/metabolite transporter superfamily protein YnfA